MATTLHSTMRHQPSPTSFPARQPSPRRAGLTSPLLRRVGRHFIAGDPSIPVLGHGPQATNVAMEILAMDKPDAFAPLVLLAFQSAPGVDLAPSSALHASPSLATTVDDEDDQDTDADDLPDDEDEDDEDDEDVDDEDEDDEDDEDLDDEDLDDEDDDEDEDEEEEE